LTSSALATSIASLARTLAAVAALIGVALLAAVPPAATLAASATCAEALGIAEQIERAARGGGCSRSNRSRCSLWPIRDDRGVFCRRLPAPGGDVLALPDPLFRDAGGRSGTGRLAQIPVLRRDRGPAGHRALHDRRLLRLPRQGPQGVGRALHSRLLG